MFRYYADVHWNVIISYNNRISNVADKSYDKSKLINCVIHLETIVSDKKILLLSHTARVI